MNFNIAKALYFTFFLLIIYIPIKLLGSSIVDKIIFMVAPILLTALFHKKLIQNPVLTPFRLSFLITYLTFSIYCILISLINPSIKALVFSLNPLATFSWVVFFLLLPIKHDKKLSKVFTSCFILIFIGLIIELIFPSFFLLRANYRVINNNFSSFFSNPNHLGAISIILFFIILQNSKKTTHKIILFSLVVLLVYSTGSRMALVSLLGGLVLNFSVNKFPAFKLKYPILFICIFCSPLFFLEFNFIEILNGRNLIWKAALESINRTFYFGTGLGHFGNLINNFSDFTHKLPMSPHNIFFGFLVETGIIGIFLFIISQLLLLLTPSNKKNLQFKTLLLIFFITQFSDHHLIYYQGFINVCFAYIISSILKNEY